MTFYFHFIVRFLPVFVFVFLKWFAVSSVNAHTCNLLIARILYNIVLQYFFIYVYELIKKNIYLFNYLYR